MKSTPSVLCDIVCRRFLHPLRSATHDPWESARVATQIAAAPGHDAGHFQVSTTLQQVKSTLMEIIH